MTETPHVESIPVDLIGASPTNPRKHFPGDYIAELADSMKQHGLLQPIVVREHCLLESSTKKKQTAYRYEIIAGECRFRAAQELGWKSIPAIVRDCDDKTVREFQLIENICRRDIDELEFAEGLQGLLDLGLTIDDLALTTGKSRTHVYGSLKLLKLPEGEAREAVRAGRLPRNHALLVARLPDEAWRASLTDQILRPRSYHYGKHGQRAVEILSFRDAKAIVEKDYMVELKGAPFDRKSLTVVPEAGSCEACPKRTGNDPEAYPDSRADVCTDPACYRRKKAAAARLLATTLNEKGVAKVPKAEAKKLLSPYRWNKREENYVLTTDKCEDDAGRRTYASLVGKELDAEKEAAVDDKGKVHYAWPKTRVAEVLKDKGIEIAVPQQRPSNGTPNRPDPLQHKIVFNVSRRWVQAIARQIYAILATDQNLMCDPMVDLLRFAMPKWIHNDDIIEALHINGKDWDESRQSVIDALPGRDALVLLLLLQLDDKNLLHIDGVDDKIQALADILEIDVQLLVKLAEQEVRDAQAKPAGDGEASPAANGTAKAKKKKAKS